MLEKTIELLRGSQSIDICFSGADILYRDSKVFKDILGVPLKSLYHQYEIPYNHRKHNNENKDFLKITLKSSFFKAIFLRKICTREQVVSDISARSYRIA